LLVATGVENTLAWLKGNGSTEALAAISWIEDCRETGDFKNLEMYREFANRYFAGGA